MATNVMTSKIADILVSRGAISADAMAAAQGKAQADSIRLEKYLLQNLLVPPAEMTLALADYLRMPPISLAHFSPNPQLVERVPAEILLKHMALPMAQCGQTLFVALGDPFDIVATDAIHAATGMEVVPLVAYEKELQDTLGRLLTSGSKGLDMEEIMQSSDSEVQVGHEEKTEVSLEEMLESAEGAPVIRMVNMILVEALRTKASDIHIEPQEKGLRLRYRIDGELVERPSPAKSYQAAIISRVKIMSDMDIAERRLPQDGRFKIRALGKEVDLRVSVLPTVFGEKVVMRVLDKSALSPSLAALGLDETAFRAMRYAIDQPHGIVLVTGPTGSGKTTTLYSCLQELNQPNVNIVTCEDPVEYQLQGINQVQVNSAIGMTFAGALRSILRQDPDIVLVGEIRDGETAEIAVKAALTGHLVLSTLHTNDAAGAVARLLDMGVPPFLLASSIILSQAQRLYRKLCLACRKEVTLSEEILRANRIDPEFFIHATTYKSVGCPKCNGTGYKGRGAIMEVLPVEEDVREAILRGKSTAELRQIARDKGMVTLKEAGLNKVKDGTTSFDAVLEVTGGE